jgi:hypothetical protein
VSRTITLGGKGADYGLLFVSHADLSVDFDIESTS